VAPTPGNVFLFAPKGVIDAGEAGIASAGDVTLVGVVKGGDAITAGGQSSGVPAVDSSGLGALAAAPVNSGAKVGDDPMKNLAVSGAGLGDEAARLRIVSVEILGFGEEVDEDERNKKNKPR
jgi:hypothetical protein